MARRTADELLSELADIYDEWLDLRTRTRLAVNAARKRGVSWERIGRELNISKQAAQQRFGTRSSAPKQIRGQQTLT